MRVIPPLTINDARLTSSTAAEPSGSETAWVSGATYAVGDVRIRTATHRKYTRLIAGAGTTAPESDTVNWVDSGPTNKWAMFDLLRNSATSQASPLTVVLTPGVRVNSIAVLATNAESITVSITSGGSPVYSYTENLIARETIDWYSYFFGTFTTKPSVIRFDMPPYVNAIITVTLTRSTGAVTCGGVVIGSFVYIGDVEASAVSDVVNYSSVDRDIYGNTTLVQRRNVPKTNQTLWLAKQYVNSVRAVRDTLNATPAVWSGLDDKTGSDYFEAVLILGVYNAFSINLDYPDYAKVTLELQEV